MQKRRGRKIVWLILDAAGYEITRRCIQAGVCPSLAMIQTKGYLGPSRPPEPNCETPPALRALFSGSAPGESGIWGYQMPDYPGTLQRAVSGFAVPISGAPAIWDELERRGESYTLINTAFRKDPVWGGGYRGFDLVVDGYRNHRPEWAWLRLNGEPEKLKFGKTTLRVESGNEQIRLYRGSKLLAAPGPEEIFSFRSSRKDVGTGYSTGTHLFLSSSSRPHVRMSHRLRDRSPVPRFIHHGNLFRFSRYAGGLSIDQEMQLSGYVSTQMAELALAAVRGLSSTLTIVYFSLIDELGHVYLDQIEGLWPEGRAAELLRRSFALLDSCIGKIMDCLDSNTLLVLSADHGQAPYRRVLHLNDLLAEAGLVRRSPHHAKQGYNLSRSLAYYHPANCGQVVVNPRRRAGLSQQQIGDRVIDCIDQANARLNSEISHIRGRDNDPFLLFLYPRGDTHITGRHDQATEILDTTRKGGQHLSPHCPTPWMQALLGLWSPAGLPFDETAIPDRNTGVKKLLLRYLFED